MSKRARRFVADELWLMIGVLTLPLAGFGGMATETASGVVGTVGWFVLTPLFLLWGDGIAALIYGDEWTETDQGKTAVEESSAVEELKRRYAEGDLSDEEFERRLDRLIAVDEADADIFLEAPDSDSADSSTIRET